MSLPGVSTRFLDIQREDVEVTQTLLGKGAMTSVHLGYYFGKKVAIKYMQPKQEQPLPDQVKEDQLTHQKVFLYKYELQRQLNFPTIVHVHGLFGRDTACPAIVMELMEESLSARSKRSPMLVEHEVCSIFADVASALDYMHSLNVIHRYISPTSILLSTVNGYLVAKITDFGKGMPADLVQKSSLEQPPQGGSIKYMAPELFDNRPYDLSVDIYCFGVILMELLLLPDYLIHILPEKRSENAAKLQEKFKADHPFPSLVNLCIAENPSDRPAARLVAAKLRDLREKSKDFAPPSPPEGFCTVGVNTDGLVQDECLDCLKWKKKVEVLLSVLIHGSGDVHL